MNSMNGKPLPHLDDSPELLALIDELVTLRIKIAGFWWEKNIGKEVDDKRIRELGREAEIVTKKTVEQPFKPVGIYYELYRSTRIQQTIDTLLKIKNYHDEGFVCKDVTFNGKPVTWTSWFPWRRSPASTEDSDRKKVFDAFLSQVSGFKELVVEKLKVYRQLLDELGVDHGYYFATTYGVPLATMKKYIQKFLDVLKPHLNCLYSELTSTYFQRKPDYYDDAWTLIYAAYRDVERECPDFRPFDRVYGFCREMGYDLMRLTLDTEHREKKIPHPFCMPVDIPHDIRVSIHNLKGFKTFWSLLHELGHAIYFSSVEPDLPVYNRYFDHRFAYLEVPSMLLGDYLALREDVRERFLGTPSSRFSEALTFLNKAKLLIRSSTAVLALAKHALYKNWSINAVTEEHKRLLDKYFDIPLIDEFWYLRPNADDAVPYVEYLYSMGIVLALAGQLSKEFGDNWWEKPDAHGKLRSIWSKGPDFTEELPEPDPESYARWLLANAGLEE